MKNGQRINSKYRRFRVRQRLATEPSSQLHVDGDLQTLLAANDRQLFYRLMHPDTSASVLQLATIRLNKQLKEIESRAGHKQLLSGRLDTLEGELRSIQNSIAVESQNETNSLRGAIRQYAPIALLEACWLQSVSNATLAHTDIAACLFQIYTDSLGYQSSSTQRVALYRKVLDDFNIFLPETHTHLFAFHPGFVDAAFTAPLTGLCLAQLPVTFLPEILGYTLASVFQHSQSLCLIEQMAHSAADIPDTLKHYLSNRQHDNWSQLAVKATHAYIMQQSAEKQAQYWHRVSLGITLYTDVENNLLYALHQNSNDIQNVWQTVVNSEQQLSDKQSDTGVINLYGNQLNDWFVNEPLVAVKFVKELVNADNPQHQNAEMRRFFSDSSVFKDRSLQSGEQRQLNHLAEKLAGLDADNDVFDTNTHLTKPVRQVDQTRLDNVQNIPVTKYTSRQLYFELLNSESHPGCLNAGYQFVSSYLAKCHAAMYRMRPKHLRLIEFSHTGFDQQIKAIYNAEANQQKSQVIPPKLSREAYLWGIEQFAPVLLVDGSWLQNIAKAGNHQHAMSRYLQRIYADEIGDGQCDWNHANVYRQLLQSTDIQLPGFTTETFSLHPGFIDSAFDLPVFFLAMSQFPSSFEAETIGLNLAIELSGLGSTYSRLVDDLSYWKIDPTIVSLHLSIDNLATGHAALAHDAVVVYLDQILNISGYADMQKHWQRIWSGYLALQIVPAGFKRALIWNYFKRFVVMRHIKKMTLSN